ncbi:hypothetical protein SAMN06296058_1358 [Pseudoxanthomonas indica]|uniref:Uncharacterized protein n=1 Tax=Pseudoxanthomonas indica TaxID=428993 RepID=A0A1T5K4J6_9GAMM|nr:hypothetical protein GCM10007235_18200 [Pseudoxanthomonas indica]SKC58583.1 hypothetical protein SAMN06296058_1358 [Pseudoxanthomonas indica]
MEIKSDNPEHGFQFPGTFQPSAMGMAGAGLEAELPRLLVAAGLDVIHEDISWQHSSNDKYVCKIERAMIYTVGEWNIHVERKAGLPASTWPAPRSAPWLVLAAETIWDSAARSLPRTSPVLRNILLW